MSDADRDDLELMTEVIRHPCVFTDGVCTVHGARDTYQAFAPLQRCDTASLTVLLSEAYLERIVDRIVDRQHRKYGQ